MEDKKKNRHLDLIDTKRMLTIASAGCIIVLFYLLIGKFPLVLKSLGRLISALSPIIIGCIIAFLLNPIVNRLRIWLREVFKNIFKDKYSDKHAHMADGISVVLSIIFFLLILTAFFWILIPSLYESINSLYDNFDKYTTNTENFVRNLVKDYPKVVNVVNNYMDDIEAAIKNLFTEKLLPNMDTVVKTLSSGIIGSVKFVFNFLIGIIAAIYILSSKDKYSAQFKKLVYAVFPIKKGNKILAVTEYIDGVFSGFISGKIIDSIIIGVICFAFCRIVEMPYAVLVSVIIGVTNIIPFFGPFIGAIPSAFLVFVESPKMCLVFIIFIVILQQIDGNILGPLILGDTIGISSFWILFAILLGGNLFGFAGMVLGVPTFACIYALLIRTIGDGLEKKGLKNDTEYFIALRGFDENGNPIRGPKKRYESQSMIKKREKQKAQLQASKELLNKVTHFDKKTDDSNKHQEEK
ncbi:MAG TPA: AI-2E family transporter [Lachnospiraceae bacterium]|nr:AI-2E family transporter [Lachnospiraceae bacterium]